MNITRHTYPFAQNFGRALSPFFARRLAGDFENQIEDMLDSVFNFDNGTGPFNSEGLFPVDLYEDEDNTYVRAELPGVDRNDISVEVADGNLEISATRKTGSGDNAETLSFKRTVLLPENTQTDKISAASKNGILTITLPKQEAAKPHKFTISVN
ncbi:MAG: Hsp20/alpha crystallin family protein [Opitutaceae bacterium]|jgi:HSP20 family protein|nr:Hsp20/alpha crystallin family protein [Opitutaceae bacterium]